MYRLFKIEIIILFKQLEMTFEVDSLFYHVL